MKPYKFREPVKGDIIWVDPDKKSAKFEPNPLGKWEVTYFYNPAWWERVLIWFGFKKVMGSFSKMKFIGGVDPYAKKNWCNIEDIKE
jgi:hypothetical protein